MKRFMTFMLKKKLENLIKNLPEGKFKHMLQEYSKKQLELVKQK